MQCDVMSMILAYKTNLNISIRTKQGSEVLETLYLIFLNALQHEIVKALGQISLHKHFKVELICTIWTHVQHSHFPIEQGSGSSCEPQSIYGMFRETGPWLTYSDVTAIVNSFTSGVTSLYVNALESNVDSGHLQKTFHGRFTTSLAQFGNG